MSKAVSAPECELVDARGHKCPTPTLRLRRALEAVAPGSRIRLLADDPLARIDVPHYVQSSGHALVHLSVVDGVVEAVVEKTVGRPGGER